VNLVADRRTLVIVLNGNVGASLGRLAIRRGWPILEVATAIQAMREVRITKPKVVVVQVSMRSAEELGLIDLLRHGGQKVAVVAVAAAHHEEVERVIRGVGVNCYLPSGEDAMPIEQAVTNILAATGGSVRAGAVSGSPRAS